MNVEDIKKIIGLDKDKFYLFRIGINEWQRPEMAKFREICKDKGIQGILIVANDFEVVEIDKDTYKLVKEEDER